MLSAYAIDRLQPLRLLALSLTVAVLMFVGGASRAAAGSGPNQNCMAAPATANRGTPVIAVLTGVTKNDNGSDVASVRRAAISKVVSAGFTTQARLLVDTIGAGRADADLAVNTQLVAIGPNSLFRQMNAACKEKGVAAATGGLMKRHISGPVDVLSALQILQSHLTGLTKRPVQVVLLSSMLNAASPLHLDPQTLGENPKKLIAEVKHAGLLPNCASWRVYVVGGGETVTGSISDPLNAHLKAFWSSFFQACGGQLVLYDTALTQFPVTPQKVTQTHRRNLLVVTLPSSILFDSGRWNLRAGSRPALNQLLRIVARHHSGAITVSGYTDSTPYNGTGGNVGLSTRRAVAVVNWLVKHAVKRNRLHAVGLGSADPVASNTTAAGRQANRRVEVTMVTSK